MVACPAPAARSGFERRCSPAGAGQSTSAEGKASTQASAPRFPLEALGDSSLAGAPRPHSISSTMWRLASWIWPALVSEGSDAIGRFLAQDAPPASVPLTTAPHLAGDMLPRRGTALLGAPRSSLPSLGDRSRQPTPAAFNVMGAPWTNQPPTSWHNSPPASPASPYQAVCPGSWSKSASEQRLALASVAPAAAAAGIQATSSANATAAGGELALAASLARSLAAAVMMRCTRTLRSRSSCSASRSSCSASRRTAACRASAAWPRSSARCACNGVGMGFGDNGL
mmetsp:Transcript_70895/g.205531  ORF Transcript_70895/g.205531 Transcript_70895/m.205531 type:complete len:284 (-) Transcript_70895:278-1129(-)